MIPGSLKIETQPNMPEGTDCPRHRVSPSGAKLQSDPAVKLRQKLLPIDYAVIIGGPAICLLIIWLGIRGIVGPPPRPSPIQMLRDGVIEIGAPMSTVQDRLGRPGRMQELPDGGFIFVYTRTVLESSGSDSLDEASVQFTPGGRVERITFDRSSPPPTK